MVTLSKFEDTLQYVNKLGFAGRGPIGQRQMQLCDVCDRIEAVSQYPIKIQFKRHPQHNDAPWLGYFVVETPDGVIKTVHPAVKSVSVRRS
jgi:hypothetical protein